VCVCGVEGYITTWTQKNGSWRYSISLEWKKFQSRSLQWPRGLKRRSSAARLLRLWVRIPPVAWMFVCCECCALSSRGLCDELITRPEESYRLWCVAVCDIEKQTSWMSRQTPTGGGGGCRAQEKPKRSFNTNICNFCTEDGGSLTPKGEQTSTNSSALRSRRQQPDRCDDVIS
jgi:hypothetical protein